MKKCILLALACSVMLSCGKRKSNNGSNVDDVSIEVVIKNVPGRHDFIDMTQYVDSVKLIPLETTEKSILSSITELFFTDQWIIVVDVKSGSILFFDYDGKYSHKISRRGRGPGEYIGISGSGVNIDKEQVMVFDYQMERLNKYDFNGNIVETINNFSDGMVVRDILCLSDGSFLAYRQDVIPNPGKANKKQSAGGVWKISPDGSFEKYIYEIDKVYPFVLSANKYHLYQLSNNGIGFVDQNFPRVYHIENDSVYKKIEFVLPGKTAADFAGVRDLKENYFMIQNNTEKGGYIFTDWSDDNNNGFVTVFSKHDSSLQVGLMFFPLVGDYFIPGGVSVRNNSNNIHSSRFSPVGLTFYRDDNAAPQLIRDIAAKILGDMTPEQIENSNPVLQLLYIKD